MKNTLSFVFVLILCASLTLVADDLTDQLKKHYIGKPVIAKMPVPDDKSVMLVYPDRENPFDMELYRLKLERVGVGLEAGSVAIIKDIEIDGREVTFHFIGIGDTLPDGKIHSEMLDKEIWGQGSCKLRIKTTKPLSEAKNKVSTLNNWLSLIMETKALVSDDDLPEEMRKAVAAKVVEAGMPRKAVFLILDDPTEVIREMQKDVLVEVWIYEKEDFSSLIIIFHDGRVHLIKEF